MKQAFAKNWEQVEGDLKETQTILNCSLGQLHAIEDGPKDKGS